MREKPAFPFFIPVQARPLTIAERGVLTRLLDRAPEIYRAQASHLMVVGRCGCGRCPTIFFEPSEVDDRETELVTCSGRDSENGLVAAVLLEKQGRLSQLEFYSIDGHDPWGIPDCETLEPW